MNEISDFLHRWILLEQVVDSVSSFSSEFFYYANINQFLMKFRLPLIVTFQLLLRLYKRNLKLLSNRTPPHLFIPRASLFSSLRWFLILIFFFFFVPPCSRKKGFRIFFSLLINPQAHTFHSRFSPSVSVSIIVPPSSRPEFPPQ